MAKNTLNPDIVNEQLVENGNSGIYELPKKYRSRNVARVAEGNVRHRFDLPQEQYITLNHMASALETTPDALVSMGLTILVNMSDDEIDLLRLEILQAKIDKIKAKNQK